MTTRGGARNGFVKLYRDILGQIIGDAGLVQLWVYLLAKAAYRKTTVQVRAGRAGRGFMSVALRPGEIVFGRHATAAELNCDPSAVRRRLDKLKALGLIDQTRFAANLFSVVSISNWDIYQAAPRKNGQPKANLTDNLSANLTSGQSVENKNNSGANQDKAANLTANLTATKEKTFKNIKNNRPAVGRRPSYRDVNGREMPWIGSDV